MLVNTNVFSSDKVVRSANRDSVEDFSRNTSHLGDTVLVNKSPSSALLVSVLLSVGDTSVLLYRSILNNSSLNAFLADNNILVLNL